MKLPKIFYVFAMVLLGQFSGVANAVTCVPSLQLRFLDGTRGCFNELWFADRVPLEYRYSLISLVNVNYPGQGYAVAINKNPSPENLRVGFITFNRAEGVVTPRAQLSQQVLHECERAGGACELVVFDGEVQVDAVSARNSPESIRAFISNAQARAQEDAARISRLEADITALQSEKDAVAARLADQAQTLEKRHEHVLRVTRAKLEQDLMAAHSALAKAKEAVAAGEQQLAEESQRRIAAEEERDTTVASFNRESVEEVNALRSLMSGLVTSNTSLQEELERIRSEIARLPAPLTVLPPPVVVSPSPPIVLPAPQPPNEILVANAEWSAVRVHLSGQQIQFCHVLKEYSKEASVAQQLRNEVRLALAQSRRDSTLSGLIAEQRFQNWVFQVKSLRLAPDGSAAMILGLPCEVAVGSFACGADIRGTIPPKTALFQQVAELGVGDFLVGVSGSFSLPVTPASASGPPRWSSQPAASHCDAKSFDAGVSEFFVVNLEAFTKKR